MAFLWDQGCHPWSASANSIHPHHPLCHLCTLKHLQGTDEQVCQQPVSFSNWWKCLPATSVMSTASKISTTFKMPTLTPVAKHSWSQFAVKLDGIIVTYVCHVSGLRQYNGLFYQ